MINKRVIPSLLLYRGGLYKTTQFGNHRYIGDPINAVKLFNEKEVDELMFFDISASLNNKDLNYNMIQNIASECFIPLSYGGGIKTKEQISKLFRIGIEKISLSSSIIEDPKLLVESSKEFGNQSIIVTIDVKKDFWGKKKVFIYNGTKNTKLDPIQFAKHVESLGAGEIIINSIDNDGVMKGFDLELLENVKSNTNIPIVALGGAGNLNHLKEAFDKCKIDAVACGSLFLYKGPLKAVLINYPNYKEFQKFLNES